MEVAANPPPIEAAHAPPGVVLEALPQGGFRVVLRRTTPAFVAGSFLALGLGGTMAWWLYPAASLPSASGSHAMALLLGLSLFGVGALFVVLCIWDFLTMITCVATPGQLQVFRGAAVFRPRLIASLCEGPIEAVRTIGHRNRPGVLCVQVRVPFIDQPLPIYHGETSAAWVALFLAKECGWQAFISSDAGNPDRRT